MALRSYRRWQRRPKLLFPPKPRRPYHAHTGKPCGKLMPRAKQPCALLEGHYGNCRSRKSVWWCDTCNKPQAGPPRARDPDTISQCFMCTEVYV